MDPMKPVCEEPNEITLPSLKEILQKDIDYLDETDPFKYASNIYIPIENVTIIYNGIKVGEYMTTLEKIKKGLIYLDQEDIYNILADENLVKIFRERYSLDKIIRYVKYSRFKLDLFKLISEDEIDYLINNNIIVKGYERVLFDYAYKRNNFNYIVDNYNLFSRVLDLSLILSNYKGNKIIDHVKSITVDCLKQLSQCGFIVRNIDELIIDIEITADNVATIKQNYFVEGNYGKLNRAKHIIFNKKAVIPDLDASFSETNLPENTYKNTASFLYPFTESSNAKNNLQSIEFKVADSSIGKNQFINYKQLTEIKTNGNVTSIGDFAFYGCTSLTTVDIDISSTDDAVEVGTMAFENTGLN